MIPSLSSKKRSPHVPPMFHCGLPEIHVYPVEPVKLSTRRNGVFFVTRLIAPPMASPSISDVTTLDTSIVCTISAGIRSSCTLRVSPSAEGKRLPFTVTEVRSALVPRTCPKRASPWSYCTLIPLIRFSASPIFESGNLPTWSALTTLVTPIELFCICSARLCPENAPLTFTSASSTPSFITISSTINFLLFVIVTFLYIGLYPTYDTFRV